MDAADLLSSLHSPKLIRVASFPEGGMRKWLSNGSPTANASSKDIILSSFSIDGLLAAWACDTGRLVIAARDTLKAVHSVSNRPKSTAWSLIKSYYSAFYYAHAALRITKTSLTYLPTSDLLHVRSIVDAYGIQHPFKMTTNQYIIRFSEVGPSLSITQKPGGDGTHQNTWAEFKQLIESCESLAIGSALDAAEKSQIEAVAKTLSFVVMNTAKSVKPLSEIRNDVQYRQLYGVWPPYGSELKGDYCLRKVNEVTSRDTSIKSFDISNQDEAISFLNRCLLVCWAVERLIEKVSVLHSKSFLKSRAVNS